MLRGFRSTPGAGNDVQGSTTFFIYVIGGIVTFASCAKTKRHRLLPTESPARDRHGPARLVRGQVKPPMASKEDIDNSGLEVIRSGVLTEYEKVGQIMPMCVDRVRLPFCCF
jgi:hypothetical protein